MQQKRLAIIITHPIQYNAPLFAMLSQRGIIDIKVFYTWSQTEKGVKYDPDFVRNIEWDIPLLEGYKYTFVNNTSRNPGSHYYKGIINPTLITKIEEWKPDSVLVYGWNFHSHLSAIRYFHKKIPVIFRGDSTLLDESVSVKSLLKLFCLRWVYKHIDFALYTGTQNKLYYEKFGVKQKQLIFAPHAIANERFWDITKNYKEDANTWRKSLNIKKDDIIFLFAGKLEYKKNPEFLINAFTKIENSTVHLIIVGNGILENNLKVKYNDVQNLHFIDFQNQSKMPIMYNLSDIFILPSKGPGETWGLAINEAMSCSKPVIVSDKCGCAIDLVQDNTNGFIFKSYDSIDLQNKMTQLIQNKHHLRKMGAESLRIIKDWNFTVICERIEKVVSI